MIMGKFPIRDYEKQIKINPPDWNLGLGRNLVLNLGWDLAWNSVWNLYGTDSRRIQFAASEHQK